MSNMRGSQKCRWRSRDVMYALDCVMRGRVFLVDVEDSTEHVSVQQDESFYGKQLAQSQLTVNVGEPLGACPNL